MIFSIQTHENIDREDHKDTPLSVWNQFLDWFHEIIYERVLLKTSDTVDIDVCINIVIRIVLYFFHNIYILEKRKHDKFENLQELVTLVRNVIRAMIKYRPQNNVDGIRNIWILKPGDNSSGRGIVLKSSLVDIIAKINQATKENTAYVIQKYIGAYH